MSVNAQEQHRLLEATHESIVRAAELSSYGIKKLPNTTETLGEFEYGEVGVFKRSVTKSLLERAAVYMDDADKPTDLYSTEQRIVCLVSGPFFVGNVVTTPSDLKIIHLELGDKKRSQSIVLTTNGRAVYNGENLTNTAHLHDHDIVAHSAIALAASSIMVNRVRLLIEEDQPQSGLIQATFGRWRPRTIKQLRQSEKELMGLIEEWPGGIDIIDKILQ